MIAIRTIVEQASLALILGALAAAAAQADPTSVFLVPEASAAARAWSRTRDLLWLMEQAAALGLPALLLFSGWGARLRTRLDRVTGGRRLLTPALFAGVFPLLTIAVDLPISATRQVLAEPFGLAAPGWSAWAGAQARGAWPLLAGALLLGWAPYWLFARSPRFWPIWAGAGLIAVAAGALLAQPLTRDLRPLTDPNQLAAVSELAARAGAPGARAGLQQIEGDDPCGEMGTVLGLGPTKVLALGSNLAPHRSDREIRAVIAHELKHYTRNDDWKALAAAALLILAALIVVSVGSMVALRLGSRRFGFHSLADPASAPLLVLLLTIFGLVGGAAFHRYGKHVEHQADRYALELTRDNAASAALSQHDLSCMRLPNPDTSWIQQTFRQNHPSLGDRVRFARDYRPWATGQKQRYAHRFRRPLPPASRSSEQGL